MIGIFDSGSGGLSVLSALRKMMPNSDIVYFGDIANAPYGLKTADELRALAAAGIAKLKTLRAGQIIAACNSVSPSVLERAANDVPVIEMTIPTARFLRPHAGEKMLLIATPATVSSGIYQKALEFLEPDMLPIPELAGAIEFGLPEGELSRILKEAFAQRQGERYDGLILGCTHYPLIRPLIEKEAAAAFAEIKVIDPAAAVAGEAAARFTEEGTGKLSFHISKESEPFRRQVARMFPVQSAPYSVSLQ